MSDPRFPSGGNVAGALREVHALLLLTFRLAWLCASRDASGCGDLRVILGDPASGLCYSLRPPLFCGHHVLGASLGYADEDRAVLGSGGVPDTLACFYALNGALLAQ